MHHCIISSLQFDFMSVKTFSPGSQQELLLTGLNVFSGQYLRTFIFLRGIFKSFILGMWSASIIWFDEWQTWNENEISILGWGALGGDLTTFGYVVTRTVGSITSTTLQLSPRWLRSCGKPSEPVKSWRRPKKDLKDALYHNRWSGCCKWITTEQIITEVIQLKITVYGVPKRLFLLHGRKYF